MMLRRTAVVTAVCSTALVLGSLAVAGAAPEELGTFTVGQTVNVPYPGCEGSGNGNTFAIKLDGDTIWMDSEIDDDPGLFDIFPFDTTGLEPGVYDTEIVCIGGPLNGVVYNATFSVVAADPCAPDETNPVPKGPGRAPHGAPAECEGSGIPDTGSDTTTVLLLGSLAIVAGTGLLIARRRTLT